MVSGDHLEPLGLAQSGKKMITGSLVLSDLTHTAGREPEHVLHQPVAVGMESNQLLLDVLLAALGAQAGRDRAETAAVVRSEM